MEMISNPATAYAFEALDLVSRESGVELDFPFFSFRREKFDTEFWFILFFFFHLLNNSN